MKQSGWKVAEIEIEPNKGATVKMVLGSETVRLHSPEFGVGRRGRKAAALARFAAKSGLGPVRRLFRFFASLPEDYKGPLSLPLLPLPRHKPTAPWDCVLVEY